MSDTPRLCRYALRSITSPATVAEDEEFDVNTQLIEYFLFPSRNLSESTKFCVESSTLLCSINFQAIIQPGSCPGLQSIGRRIKYK